MSRKAAFGLWVVVLVVATTGANIVTNLFTDSFTLRLGLTLAVAVIVVIVATIFVARLAPSPKGEDASYSIRAEGPGSVAAKTITGGVSTRTDNSQRETDDP
jgi:hypothetical protein